MILYGKFFSDIACTFVVKICNTRRYCDISFIQHQILLNVLQRSHVGDEKFFWLGFCNIPAWCAQCQNLKSLKFCLDIILSPQMTSLGKSSKWPSYDSLPSTSSFHLSESEQTEDEADVFSEGEGGSGITKSLSVGEGITLSRNHLEFTAHPDQPHSRFRSLVNQPGRCPDENKHPGSASSPGAATLGSSSATPGDLVFAQKVRTPKRIPRPLFQHFCQPHIRSVILVKLFFLLISSVCRFAQVYPAFAWASSWTKDWAVCQRYVVEQYQTSLFSFSASILSCNEIHKSQFALTAVLYLLYLLIVTGLSSFQQSVAIDRLQRILGILQRPEMG